MTGLHWLFTLSLAFVLTTPDSVSHNAFIKLGEVSNHRCSPQERTFIQNPIPNNVATMGLAAPNPAEMLLSAGYKLKRWPSKAARFDSKPINRAAPVDRALRNPQPFSSRRNDQDPSPSQLETVHGAALVPASGRQLVERLRRRRDALRVMRDVSRLDTHSALAT